jgi:flavin-dependent dehydrogenase
VIIVGGGPAGSSCAWRLHQAGLDSVVLDKATFPRDKVCAGWITRPVVAALDLDLHDYARGRTLQPITGFRVGVIGSERDVTISYGQPVSFGIRRCEFDNYLLQRSRATLRLGEAARTIRRDRGRWIVNDSISAPLLVGAGGHFCPVARMLNARSHEGALVVAQEAEFRSDSSGPVPAIEGRTPELYFSRDLKGYGWCFRKQGYLNVGLGRTDGSALPRATRAFVDYLLKRRRLTADVSGPWRGHAYLLSEPRSRRIIDDGVMLVGDAAGLASPQSGEGIRSAVDSGLLAATTIVDLLRARSSAGLMSFETRLDAHVGRRPASSRWSPALPPAVVAMVAAPLLRLPSFVRHVVLNRWFLANQVAD